VTTSSAQQQQQILIMLYKNGHEEISHEMRKWQSPLSIEVEENQLRSFLKARKVTK